MTIQKPSIPKGTRDFSAEEVNKRQFIFDTIRHQFQLFGYAPIETPSFENLSTLTGKYGEEGDRLIFKILNSGDFLSKVDEQLLQNKDSQKLTSQISEKALRYDLTVPFARYVVQHQNEITLPFKRYQMQAVWRADRPQKGRFREFYQCDADVVGSTSLLQEVELISLYDAVFSELKVPVEIHINNRKILSGLAEVAHISDKIVDFTVALDKLDKIGEEKVKEEMLERGIPQTSIDKLSALFSMSGEFDSQLNDLAQILQTSNIGKEGIEELRFVFEKIKTIGLQSAELILNLTLARGLDYYTGAILEVKAKNVQLGSIGGGGRYDDLTGIFGLKNLSGVGISFGLDRIYLVLEELSLFPDSLQNSLDVLFINFGEKEAEKAFLLSKILRKNNIRCEVYPEVAKMKKQMQYADKRAAKYVILLGEDELKNQKITLKNMISGKQFTFPDGDLLDYIQA
ncbi:MAG: histidine--tRNA ligase [Weeksellaceae bacterium]|jgi:histidyl-tRNA synthetase|nr:histidine--tRNA ligase [Weeksellaceae bacterium]